MRELSKIILILVIISGFFLAINPLFAQSPAATLVGRVVDPTGGLIPEVSLTVRNVETNELRKIITGKDGQFTVTDLPPGTYDLAVEKEGFDKLIEKGLELQVDQVARLDLKLAVGTVNVTVEVKAEMPVLNTENASKGEVVTNEEMIELPLEGRNFQDLAFMVPGVMPKAQGASGSQMAINGARADNTNFVVDGFNDQNPRGAGSQVQPPIDTMQEFKMQTTGYSAEFGRLAGGVMNMVLKSGTNRPHGALFEFVRNDLFDTRNTFALDKQKLRRNQFGGTLDGPVYIPKVYNGRDRTFFLFGWESYRQVVGSTKIGRIPTVLERQGDFSQSNVVLADPFTKGSCGGTAFGCFAGNKIPMDRFNPVSTKLLPYYPLPNQPGQANNFVASGNDNDQWDSFVAKIDQRLSSSDHISARFLKRFNRTTAPFGGSPLGTFPSLNRVHQSMAGVNYTHMFTPVLINDLRVGFTRTTHNETGSHQGTDYASQLGITGTTTDPALIGFPRFTIRDLLPVGDENKVPFSWVVNNYQLNENLTWVRGGHTMKFGFDFLRTQFFQLSTSTDVRGTFNFLGRFTNAPLADFLLGTLNDSTRQLGKNQSYLFMGNYGFWAQDDIKLRHDLTLNLGMRYDILMPPFEKYGLLANFVPGLNKLIVASDSAIPDFQQRIASANLTGSVALASQYDLPRSLVYTNYKNLAPRIGIAWRPFGNRTVIRGGYGIFYGTSMLDPINKSMTSVYPMTISQQFNRTANNPAALTLSNPFPDAKTQLNSANNVDGYDMHAPPQYLQSWNFTIEREIGRGAVIEMGYVGSKGTHLGWNANINQPIRTAAGNLPRLYPAFNNIQYYQFSANSSYNAGMVTFRKRFSNGLFYKVNYVYGKSIDEGSQIDGSSKGGIGPIQNINCLRCERARSDWDIGHAVTMSLMYEVPIHKRFVRGWQIGTTGRMYTGQPFTPQTSNVQLNLGEANRPDRINKGTIPNPTPNMWFDLKSFPVIPTGSYRFGNSGRNILDGPGTILANLSLMKKFYVKERSYFQLRVESFNILNHPNYNLPNNNVNAANGGIITQADDGRVIQIGLKYQF